MGTHDSLIQPDAPKSYRQKVRGRISKRLISLKGTLKNTIDVEPTPGSASHVSENISDNGEEDQPNADTDRQDPDTEHDMWAKAEQKLRKDDKKRYNLEKYDRILEAHFGAKLEPIGTQSRRNQFYEFLTSEVEDLHRARTEDNTKWRKCKRKAKQYFETAAKVVVASKDIIAPATNACLPAGVACTGVVVILSFCLKAIEQRQVLFESLDYVSGSIYRIAEYEALCRNNSVVRNEETDAALTDACCNIIEFQAQVLCFLQTSPLASAIRNTFEWDGWSKMLSGMTAAETRVKACAEREQMNNVVKIYSKVSEIAEIANELKQQKRAQEAEARSNKANDLLQLLYRNTCIYEESKQRNRERILGTCDWFTNHDLFKNWDLETISGTASILYVTADPGCGKSVLSRYLIDKILPDDKRTVCYFFFKDDFEQQKTANSALCTLLHQIFDNNHHLLTPGVLDTYGARGETLVESFVDLWKLFIDAASHQETVCVLDALDECQESDMKRLVEAVTGAQVPGLKFLLTSRPYAYIRRAFSSRRLSFIHLQGDREDTANEIAEEIKLVVDNRVDTTANAFGLTPDEHRLMREQVTSVPNRTYLWISLVFDGLMNGSDITKKDIVNLAKQLPRGIYAAYEKILRKSQDREKSKRLLHLILGAERPLTLSEVSVALEFDGQQTWEDVKDCIIPKERVQDTLRNLCGLFVAIVDDRVYLLHQTAREFLLCNFPTEKKKEIEFSGFPQSYDNGLARFIAGYLSLFLTFVLGIAQPLFHQMWLFMTNSWQNSMHLSKSNEILATTCIACLQIKSADEQNISMFEYAAKYWPTHYRQSGEKFRVRMGKATRDLCLQAESVTGWTEIYRRNGNIPDDPLCLASYLGIDGAVKVYLDEDISTTAGTDSINNSKDTKYGQTPLSWAAENGHETVVRLLIATGYAQINSRDVCGRTPLFWAAENGYEAVVRLLLATRQAEIDPEDIEGRTPLLWASLNGHEATVELLLATGQAKINFRDKKGRTPLIWAAQNGHEAVVRLLLATGQAEIDWKDSSGRTPLSWAVKNGHEAVINLIKANGGT
ncbi:ankyrin repeat-containing protein [Grosmannia clavigera kw1407]|uniref:Ankyrin repeat-containing protein n=1 Tax=Grosmannia clavigera (strain kw1407 / UAMH 11150) TaxID=655863 RepID=F0XQS9_GROCL|nr:ankyrin repeat-containing protein [Grosmannia clavigera kw1407]EFW99839.1 ankyrin repeat-containing protein [Grosmannia clavigera kw1407]